MFGMVSKKAYDTAVKSLEGNISDLMNTRDDLWTQLHLSQQKEKELEARNKEMKEAAEGCSKDYQVLLDKHQEIVGDLSAMLAKADATIDRLVAELNKKYISIG